MGRSWDEIFMGKIKVDEPLSDHSFRVSNKDLKVLYALIHNILNSNVLEGIFAMAIFRVYERLKPMALEEKPSV